MMTEPTEQKVVREPPPPDLFEEEEQQLWVQHEHENALQVLGQMCVAIIALALVLAAAMAPFAGVIYMIMRLWCG